MYNFFQQICIKLINYNNMTGVMADENSAWPSHENDLF